MAAGDTGYRPDSRGKVDPAPHLAPYRWKPGQKPPGGGKPKGLVSLRRRFRDAFAEAPPDGEDSLVKALLAMARGRIVKTERVQENGEVRYEWCYVESKNQMAAIRFMAEYGFGAPPKALDDDTTRRLAEQMVAGMLNEARARAAEQKAADSTDAIDVTARNS